MRLPQTRNRLATSGAKSSSGQSRGQVRKDTYHSTRINQEQLTRQHVTNVKEAVRGPV